MRDEQRKLVQVEFQGRMFREVEDEPREGGEKEGKRGVDSHIKYCGEIRKKKVQESTAFGIRI